MRDTGTGEGETKLSPNAPGRDIHLEAAPVARPANLILSSLFSVQGGVPSPALGLSDVERFSSIAADHFARAVCNVD